MNNIEKDDKAKKYFGSMTKLNVIFYLFVSLSWILGFFLLEKPILALLSSLSLATILLLFYSVFRFRVDKKYKNVDAGKLDYILANLPLYLLVIVPFLFLFFVNNVLPNTGSLMIIYFNCAVLFIFILFSKLPHPILFGVKPSVLSTGPLFSELNALAQAMSVKVEVYTVNWKKFKIVNALQSGTTTYSIFISNFLIENFTLDEIKGVFAHELAHAKMKHILKLVAASLFFSIIGLNLLLFSRTITNTISQLVMLLVGIVMIYGGNAVYVPFLRRKFELQADILAVKSLNDKKQLISALVKLSELNLIPKENPRMSWGLSHPSMTERIKKIQDTILENP